MGRSMMYLEMLSLIRSMPLAISKDDFSKAIIDENALEKPTLSSRKESLIRLTQLYGMDTSKALFRVFWGFGHADLESLPQLCLVCAYARDPQHFLISIYSYDFQWDIFSKTDFPISSESIPLICNQTPSGRSSCIKTFRCRGSTL